MSRKEPVNLRTADASAEASNLLRTLDAALAAVRNRNALDGDSTLAEVPSERAVRRLVERIAELRGARSGHESKHISAESAVEQLEQVLEETRKRSRRAQRAYDQETANAEEWERRAMLCVHSGDDALARESLVRKSRHLNLAAHLKHEADLVRAFVEGLEVLVQQVRAELKEAPR